MPNRDALPMIQLTQSKWATVSEEDFDYLAQWNWFAARAGKRWIAGRNSLNPDGKRETLLMHRVVAERAGIDTSRDIDHVNRDSLDNARKNLRAATRSENSRNSTGKHGKASGLPKGVYRNRHRFMAIICLDYKNHYLGTFGTQEEAIAAYNAAASAFHGNFARFSI